MWPPIKVLCPALLGARRPRVADRARARRVPRGRGSDLALCHSSRLPCWGRDDNRITFRVISFAGSGVANEPVLLEVCPRVVFGLGPALDEPEPFRLSERLAGVLEFLKQALGERVLLHPRPRDAEPN